MSEADHVEPQFRKQGDAPLPGGRTPASPAPDVRPEEPEPWDHPAIKAEHKLIAEGEIPGKHEFAGLAFSGGGIRSATFGLGVLQALKARQLLEKFDYLSSVSGGGYISAWLSANCRRHGKGWLSKEAKWDDSIKHLRRFSNYLSPQVGFFSADTWSMLMIWVRNALLIQLTVLLGLAALLLVPRILALGFSLVPFYPWARGLTVGVFIAAVVSVGANLISLHYGMQPQAPEVKRPIWSFSADGWKVWSPMCALFVLGAWICCKISDFDPFSNGPVSPMAFPIALFMMAAGFCGVPPLLAIKCLLLPSSREDSVINYGQRQVQVTVVLPVIVTAAMLAAVMWGILDPASSTHPMFAAGGYSEVLAEGWLYWPFPLAVAFAAFVLLAFCSMRGMQEPPSLDQKLYGESRVLALAVALMPGFCSILRVKGHVKGIASRFAKRSVMAFLASMCCILALHALFGGIVLLMQGWKSNAASGVWHAYVLAPPLILLAFSLSITLLIGLIGQSSVEAIREWWARIAAWLSIYAFGWTLLMLTAVYGPLAAAWIAAIDVSDKDNWAKISAAGTWIVATLGSLLAANSSRSNGDNKIRSNELTMTDKAINVLAVFGPYVFVAGLMLGIATAIHLLLWRLSADEATNAWLSAQILLYGHWQMMDVAPSYLFGTFLFCLVTWLFLSYRVDINIFSLNAFYRNRLVRCYLGASRLKERKPQNFTAFDEADDMPMSELAHHTGQWPQRRPEGPIHIVNCALNLGGSSDLDLHTRHSASFTITPYMIGSVYLKDAAPRDPFPGYRPHHEYGTPGKHVSLGQAISVSGAAASPNMGYHSSPATALLLTLFNVRLGWWFRSPVRHDAQDSSPRFAPLYLLSELFAVAHDKLKYLMVSDGGHFENLGVYELIRRRCRFIVLSDAECDPEMKFEGLGTLIRMCKIDFNVDIEIDVSKFALSSGFSGARFAKGVIRYNDKRGTIGQFIYIKAAMDGTSEGTSIRQYRESHPDFPHESTGDQFYGEDQFESYRALGYDIAFNVFEKGLSAYEWIDIERTMPDVQGNRDALAGSDKRYKTYRPERGPLAAWPLANKRWRHKRKLVRL